MKIREEQKRELKRVSFIYIPHSGVKVFRVSFHVNMLRFLFVICILLLFGVILVFNKESIFLNKKRKLEQKYNMINIILSLYNDDKMRFDTFTKDFYKSIKTFREVIINDANFTKFSSNSDTLKNQLDLTNSLLVLEYIVTVQHVSEDLPFGWPIKSGFITSSYGNRFSPFDLHVKNFHYGYDFANLIGTPLIAVEDGVVLITSFDQNGYGTHIKILHKFGFISLYAHANKIFVYDGQKVQKGQKIASLGMTGFATGPHVHYEIRLLSNSVYNPLRVPLNPLPYISE